MAIASGNGSGGGSGVTLPSAAATDGPVAAREGFEAVDATADGSPPPTATPSRTTAPCEQPPTFPAPTPGSPRHLKLANGTLVRFERQRVPDPPSISFAKDLPRLMRTWVDGFPEWNPSDAVLHIQGEPIALEYWKFVYRYGKPGQWTGTKKSWAHWRVSVRPRFLLRCGNAYRLTCPGHCHELASAHGGGILAQIL